MKLLSLKEKALNYRKGGYSYNMISKKLGLAKSTLSDWFRQIDFVPNQEVLSRINSARKKLMKLGFIKHQTAIKLRNEIRQKSREEIKNLSKKDLWYVGTILYLGEGNKSQGYVRLSNSDPRVIKLFIRWLKITCGVDPKDIRAAVHIYQDNNPTEAICYWSEIAEISESQFKKTQVDKRIKKSKIKFKHLPYGTLHLWVKKSRNLFQRISGWIEGILEKIS